MSSYKVLGAHVCLEIVQSYKIGNPDSLEVSFASAVVMRLGKL